MDPIHPKTPSVSQVFNTMFNDKSYVEDVKLRVLTTFLAGISIVGIPLALVNGVLTAYDLYKSYQLVKERLQTPIEDIHVTLENKHEASAKTFEKLRAKRSSDFNSRTATVKPDASATSTSSDTAPGDDSEVHSKHPETPKLTLNQMHQILDHNPGQVIRLQDNLTVKESADQSCVYLDNDDAERPATGEIAYHVITSDKPLLPTQVIDEMAAKDKAVLDSIMPPHTDSSTTRYNKTIFNHQIACPQDREAFDEVLDLVRAQMSKPNNGIYLAKLPSATTPILSLAYVDTEHAVPQVGYLKHKIERLPELLQAKREAQREAQYEAVFLGHNSDIEESSSTNES